jgi:hypothetical protein
MPSFSETRNERREGRAKTVHIEKRGDQKNVFSPKINGPHQSFHSPVLICLAASLIICFKQAL